jgi:hypothetical protein
MFDKVLSSNSPNLPVPAEGEYIWHLEVIVVAVGIDPVSCEYETDPVVESSRYKKNKNKWSLYHLPAHKAYYPPIIS